MNEFKSFSNRFRNSDTIRIKDQREYKRIMKYLDKRGHSYYDIGHGKGEWHIQFDNTRDAGRIRAELEKKRFKIIDPNNESVNEASDKIQVQGVGSYDYKSLKKKVQRMSSDLLKSAKREQWKKSSKNGIRAFAEMWDALAKYEEKK